MISKRVLLFAAIAALGLGLGGCESLIDDELVDDEQKKSFEKYKLLFGPSEKGGSGGSENKG